MCAVQGHSVRDTASAFELALVAGAVDVQRVVAWADEVIAESEAAPSWAISLSLASSRSSAEVLSLLHAVPGELRVERAWALYFGLLCTALDSGRLSPRRVVSVVCRQQCGGLGAAPHRDAFMLWDSEYRCCYEGVGESSTVDAEVRAFLEAQSVPFR